MMKNVGRYILLCTILASWVFFDACKVGPDFKPQRTEIDSLAVYRFDSLRLATEDSVLNIRWWEMFQDSILDSLITIGLEENKDLLIATARIEQSEAILGITRADLYPSFGYSVGASRGNVNNGAVLSPDGDALNLFSGFGTLSWEIDFWGKFRRSQEAARAELIASEYGKRSVQIGLIARIASTYYLLLDFKWRLFISNQTYELRKQSEDIIRERFNGGIAAEIELNQAQIQTAIAAGAIPVFKRSIGQTENALAVLLGRNPHTVVTGADLADQPKPPDVPVGIPSMLMTRRPDVLQTEMLVHAQNARIGVAVAQRFPSISLTGLLGVASTELSNINLSPPAFSAGAMLAGPIFEFGKNKRRVELERKRTEEAMYAYEKTVITAFQEVEDALIEISTYKDQLTARQNHVAAAQNARILSAERYDKGVTSYLELIESQRQAFEAQLSLSETTRGLFDGYINLYKALGGGWLSPAEEAGN